MNKKFISTTTAGVGLALALVCAAPGVANAAPPSDSFGHAASSAATQLPTPTVTQVTRGADDVSLTVRTAKSGTLVVRDSAGQVFLRTALSVGSPRTIAPAIGADATTLELTLAQGDVESEPLTLHIDSAADSKPAAPKASVLERQSKSVTIGANADRIGTYIVRDDAGRTIGSADVRTLGGTARVSAPVGAAGTTLSLSFVQRGIESDRTSVEVPAYSGSFVPLMVTSSTAFTIGHTATLSGTATPGARLAVRLDTAGFSKSVAVGADGNWHVATPVLRASQVRADVQQYADGDHDAVSVTLRATGLPTPIDPVQPVTPIGSGTGNGNGNEAGNGVAPSPVTDKPAAPRASVTDRPADGATIALSSDQPGTFVVYDAAHRVIGRTGSTPTTRTGVWVPVGPGEVTVTAELTDRNGVRSDPTTVVVPAFTGTVDAPVTVTSSPTFTDGAHKVVTGTSEPNARITVTLPGYGFSATTTASAEGKWSVTLPHLQASGLLGNTVTAVATTRQTTEFDLVRG
ncbi:hypothetical protein [Curtobacterium sp. MCBA15_008]|uniref:hypothetical protein n=1 Tax=Curtobacterium sp. MCBA15_008 TaxID=1898736 RepID=UPI0008DE5AF0|nr:hypothetical protein [Curtobacterium sp. MCBA15_008]OII06892.1 hypothetical protein BIU96_04755 [Curtobacterium sp. MCBA15_008]